MEDGENDCYLNLKVRTFWFGAFLLSTKCSNINFTHQAKAWFSHSVFLVPRLSDFRLKQHPQHGMTN